MTDNTERWRRVNNEWAEPYVVDLISQGLPLWFIEIESGIFRTHMDLGAAEGYLHMWNIVRKKFNLEPLDRTILRRRMRDSNGWTEEYSLWEEMAMDHYRDHNNFDVPEFVGKKFIDGREDAKN